MPTYDIESLAYQLWDAQFSRTPCQPVTERAPALSTNDAYRIQKRNVDRRCEERGLFGRTASLVGYKVGLTSDTLQEWLGVYEPDFGHLLDDMAITDGDTVDLSVLLQPRAEAELAFVLNRPLAGPGVTAGQVLAATDFVVPAIEIIDSRIADWQLSYADTVADNASSGLFVLGTQPMKLGQIDLRRVGMTLRHCGEVSSTGAGAACLGNPVNAVVWLANKLGELGTTIEAGQVVLSGALGPVVNVEAGDWLDAQVGRSRVSVRFAPTARKEDEE